MKNSQFETGAVKISPTAGHTATAQINFSKTFSASPVVVATPHSQGDVPLNSSFVCGKHGCTALVRNFSEISMRGILEQYTMRHDCPVWRLTCVNKKSPQHLSEK